MSVEAGKRLGDYEILGVLGMGGMGRVYKVRNVISDRVEAMKVLLPDLAGRQELGSRFLREIKVLAALNHPNIAALRTALTLDNQLVMIMEYVEGTTLASRLEQGPIPPSEALNYVNQVLGALSYAHGQNVIHRDIKPSNMILAPQGIVKLMDFGIARSSRDPALTATGTTLGSLYYMSPEQVRGEIVDCRSDVYSVGVSLYEMVTGERPFQSDSDLAIMTAHLLQTPRPPIELRPDLPEGLNDIIVIAMAKNPAERFQSADAFRAALKTVGASRAVANPGLQEVLAAPMRPGETTVSFLGSSPTATMKQHPAALTLTAMPAPPQNQPVVRVPELSQRQGSHRGLYMALGALIGVAVLVAAGLYLPRSSKASVEGNTGSAAQIKQTNSSSGSTSIPAIASDSINNTQVNSGSSSQVAGAGTTARTAANPAGPRNSESPARDTSATDSNTSRTETSSAKTGSLHSRPKAPLVAGERDTLSPSSDHGGTLATQNDTTPDQSGSGLAAQSQRENAKEVEELERQIDQLASRAGSVQDSLEHLRRQQAAQGLGLRGDIASSQGRMEIYLGKAQAALRSGDARDTKKYMELVEPEIEKLEKFLGR